MPVEIDMPFRADGSGRIAMTDDPDAQVRLHVLALLSTIPEERAMVPGYGTRLIDYVFENPDGDEVATMAAVTVQDAFRDWEPGVELVEASADEADSEGNIAVVKVDYRRLDAADSGTVANANQAVISANGVVREVVRG